MPKGYPDDPDGGSRGGYRLPLDKQILRERIKEFEARIKQMDRREKALGDLKKWLATRKLDGQDLLWMYRQMQPKRANKPVKSKKPLKPEKSTGNGYLMSNGKLIAPKGDPEFRRRLAEARIAKGWNATQVGEKIGVSHGSISSYECGRYVPREELRVKLVKLFDLPASLGAEATKAMQASMGGSHPKS